MLSPRRTLGCLLDRRSTCSMSTVTKDIAHFKTRSNMARHLLEGSGVVLIDNQPTIVLDGPTIHTGGGGFHLYVESTGVGNKTSFIPHCDWRGRGGYVVAPPSLHESGRRYQWWPSEADPWSGPAAPLQPAPPWLLDLLEPPRPTASPVQLRRPVGNAYARRALESEVEIVTSAPKASATTHSTERRSLSASLRGRAPRHRRRRRRPVSGRRSLRPGSARKPQHHRIGPERRSPAPTGAVDVNDPLGAAKEPFRCRGEPRQNGAGDNAGQRRRSGQGQSHQPDERTVALVPASTIKPRAVR